MDLRDPRVDALTVIENALSGLSSDLGTAVREKRGLVYFVGAFDRPAIEPGLFALYAGTREETAEQVEKLIDAETARLAKKGLRDDEIDRAKKQILAAQDMSLQDNGALAQTCALNELYGLGYDYNFKFEERMQAVTPDSDSRGRGIRFPAGPPRRVAGPAGQIRKRKGRNAMTEERPVAPEEIHKAYFVQLVLMLSGSALQQMGKLIDPQSKKAQVNLEAAQATIDLLDMIEAKTKGNLDKEEERMLRDTLMSLKMNFVETMECRRRRTGSLQPASTATRRGKEDSGRKETRLSRRERTEIPQEVLTDRGAGVLNLEERAIQRLRS